MKKTINFVNLKLGVTANKVALNSIELTQQRSINTIGLQLCKSLSYRPQIKYAKRSYRGVKPARSFKLARQELKSVISQVIRVKLDKGKYQKLNFCCSENGKGT